MSRKFDLTGKRAIVTGGASGIGEAIVKTLAAAGAETHMLDVSQENAARVVKECMGTVIAHTCDVSSTTQMISLIKEIAGDGTLEILVNNAGIAHIGNIENTTPEDMKRLFDVNVMGVYNGIKAVLPFMKQFGGAIVNMASVASSVGIKDRLAYTMTKGAVYSLSMSAAKDYLVWATSCLCISGDVMELGIDGLGIARQHVKAYIK